METIQADQSPTPWFNFKRIAALAATLLLSSGDVPSNTVPQKEDVDLVQWITPVQEIPKQASIFLDSLSTTQDFTYLDKAIGELGMNMFKWLWIDPNNTKSVKYTFVTEWKDISAEDATGLLHDGHVRNEVMATVTFNDWSIKEYFLRCANGLAREKWSIHESDLASEHVVIIEQWDRLWDHYGADAYRVAIQEEIPLFYRDSSNPKIRHYLYTEQEVQAALNQWHKVIADMHAGDVVLH